MAVVPAYPFEPRSIATLRAGQFWAVPLSDGRFACGRVLYVPIEKQGRAGLYLNTKTFLAGLLDWTAHCEPTATSIAGAAVLDCGLAHVRTIRDSGGQLLGWRDLGDDMIDDYVPERVAGDRPYEVTAPLVRTGHGVDIWPLPFISLRAEVLFVGEGSS